MGYYYHQADPTLYHKLQEFAKKNRSNPTDAERILWQFLKDKQLGHFRRQYIIGDYIADFVCLEHNLIIELDGECHEGKENRENDEVRQRCLEKQGYTVIRFANEMVIESKEQVLKTINKYVCPDLPFAEI